MKRYYNTEAGEQQLLQLIISVHANGLRKEIYKVSINFQQTFAMFNFNVSMIVAL